LTWEQLVGTSPPPELLELLLEELLELLLDELLDEELDEELDDDEPLLELLLPPSSSPPLLEELLPFPPPSSPLKTLPLLPDVLLLPEPVPLLLAPLASSVVELPPPPPSVPVRPEPTVSSTPVAHATAMPANRPNTAATRRERTIIEPPASSNWHANVLLSSHPAN
jgi:hypothetical protein